MCSPDRTCPSGGPSLASVTEQAEQKGKKKKKERDMMLVRRYRNSLAVRGIAHYDPHNEQDGIRRDLYRKIPASDFRRQLSLKLREQRDIVLHEEEVGQDLEEAMEDFLR